MPMRISPLLCLAGWLLLVGLPSVNGREQTPSYEFYETPLPYRVAWGLYTVTVEATGTDEKHANRVQILDRAGRVQREINAQTVSKVDFVALDGEGRRNLRVVTAPGNNLQAHIRTYCFTCRGGLRNVLVMPYEFDHIQDLDRDGRPEILGDNWAPLEYSGGGGLCHAAYPPVYLILRWDGGRYTVANRRFPAVVRAEVAKKKKQFLKELEKFNDPQGKGLSWDYLVGDALGIWADLSLIGRQREAQRWLLPHLLHQFMRENFLEMLPGVRKRLAKLPAQVRPDQSRRLHAPSYLDDSDDDET